MADFRSRQAVIAALDRRAENRALEQRRAAMARAAAEEAARETEAPPPRQHREGKRGNLR